MLDRLAAAVLIAALALPACASSAARRATKLYDKGDYAGAVGLADRELAQHPGDDALWRVRVRAALALGDADAAVAAYLRWRGDGAPDRESLQQLAFDTLDSALRAPSAAIQVQAIQAVEELEIQNLSVAVADEMGDEDDVVAAAAAVAILRAYPQAPGVATEMMASEDADARVLAIAGIGKKVGRLAVDDLRAATADGDARVRRAAVVGLAPLGDPVTVQLLVRLARRDPAGDVRASALLALARSHAAGEAALASAALGDAFLGARLAAVELLAAGHERGAIDRILDGADLAVAVRAARAARAWNRPGAARALDRALAAGDWTVRSAALNVLADSLDRADALARARRALAAPDAEVRMAAARALISLDASADAIPVLRAILDAPPPVAAAPPALAVPAEPPAPADPAATPPTPDPVVSPSPSPSLSPGRPPSPAPSPSPSPAPSQDPAPSPSPAPSQDPAPSPSPAPAPLPPPAATSPTLHQRIQAAIDLARLHDSRGLAALSAFASDRAAGPDARRAAVAGHGIAHTVSRGLVLALADASATVRVEAARTIYRLTKDD